jgi:hypothetical protein
VLTRAAGKAGLGMVEALADMLHQHSIPFSGVVVVPEDASHEVPAEVRRGSNSVRVLRGRYVFNGVTFVFLLRA